MKKTAVFLSIALSFALANNVKASTLLPPGAGPVLLSGASVAIEADLAGEVVRDQLIPFQIRSVTGALLFQGTLQDRVVKSNRNGDLHFYQRVRDTRGGLNGTIRDITRNSFAATPMVLVDWRPDGLGDVPPKTAKRSIAPGAIVQFNFMPGGAEVLVGGRESKFFYIKTASKEFTVSGITKISLASGQSILLKSAQPK